MGNKAKSDAKALALAERRQRVMALRRGGASFPQIGRDLGINQATAYRDFQRALKDIPKEAATEALAVELQRLDVMFSAIWPRAYGGTESQRKVESPVPARRSESLGVQPAHAGL